MFSLKKITKDYGVGSSSVRALKGVSIDFRKNEFVSILGPSGCGKTTLLNIIGGLDQYTTGDLIINGRSTKEYKDRDWDAYRNHSIGFVFQSYNLIPHQSVLQNVELALTLSGVSKSERRQRAKKALEEVGLADQLHKKPSEMSGGQMQRVAIARALVNNPDIILADEPTGALDTETSVQVMEILKSISQDRLIIMVTHNPDLAEKYSSRIIRMLDGEILSDSDPLTEEEKLAEEERARKLNEAQKQKKKEKKPSMSFGTSFMLSLKNLFTKKGRTILTSFAGSIGIIGIALIIAVSQGTTSYINSVQETTLSSYPISLEAKTVDLTSLMESFMNIKNTEIKHDKDAIYKDPMIGELVDALSKVEEERNDLAAFKRFLEAELQKENSPLKDAVSGIQYAYDINLPVYTKNPNGDIIKSDSTELMMEMLEDFMFEVAASGSSSSSSSNGSSGGMSSMMMTSMSQQKMWQELLPGLADANGNRDVINSLLTEQYDVIYGSWPTAKEEIVLIVDENNELDDLTLYALGLLDRTEIDAIIDAAANGKPLEKSENQKWTYEELCQKTFKTIMPYDFYTDFNNDGIYEDMSENPLMLEGYYNNALELRIVGIIRPSESADTTMLTGAIGYTYHLTEYIINGAKNSDVVKAQLANPNIDVLTGLPFESTTGDLTVEAKKEAFLNYINHLNDADKAKAYVAIKAFDTIQANLETQTNAMLNMFQDKNQLIDMIVGMIGTDSGMDPARIREIFEERTLDELKTMIRPSIEESIAAQIKQQTEAALSSMPDEAKIAALELELASYTTEQIALYYDEITEFSENDIEKTMTLIGNLDLNSPSMINIYASSFENKDIITAAIQTYNNSVEEAQKIAYTDYLGILMSGITMVINAISYVLIAFVSIPLIVSSIMIGVITLISVQERTKEIGILRAIGASKRDVSGMFNAETMIIGFSSGLLGVVVTYLLCLPINAILKAVTEIDNLRAILPIGAALLLIAISVFLTLISGIIPSRSAAKKDPVVALRSE